MDARRALGPRSLLLAAAALVALTAGCLETNRQAAEGGASAEGPSPMDTATYLDGVAAAMSEAERVTTRFAAAPNATARAEAYRAEAPAVDQLQGAAYALRPPAEWAAAHDNLTTYTLALDRQVEAGLACAEGEQARCKEEPHLVQLQQQYLQAFATARARS